ncbi:MAG: tRNA (N(6)-L-threonylcarbamoyladenosine(37)-C(2))-methylthiotransferase [Candidatus Korarchaeota archaeon]|nr:tRNA (N(6)-L-threonylcarbamoyladenosine(37)-C(2))-methylthiotransferase [Candidatus Korarchaeota archaeon]NIU82866.1 tRNA (N(6)-L-threonylcarbamoyladenosine(37)-C(2))-methylthiotransferase [Candidatus Thorarchaeota archaeon]NIW12560.1 tRNA (N(6)-L-threonylcarbamoyladenosine(37)-C(2))-methylthiotransferase [Candidatus Thorarchaeota archaeon]NIW50780.1 tRNA (N(6)-L-threonylcarbamoyladenosine(37)-C(2))-methylthiotransferase [Candidatus Korarchaeota archaeon]
MVEEKVYCETSGCSANQARGSVIKGILKNSRLQLVETSRNATTVILNTCAIKQPTENRILHRIKEFKETGKTLIVAGCLPMVLSKKIRLIDSNVSLVGPHTLDQMDSIVRSTASGERVTNLDWTSHDYLLKPRVLNGLSATVPIAKGCIGNCTYCVDKRIFGELVSFPRSKILKEVQRLVENGIREIRLSGQDTGPWGQERGENLAMLLKGVSELEGEFMVRVGMASPDTFHEVVDQVIEVIKKDQRFYRFFHLPVQSGSNEILRKMNRNYKREVFVSLVQKIRKELNEPTIVTDVIVGFPGESTDDFKHTLSLIKQTEPEKVNISRYNDRPKVSARKMEGHLPSNIKKTRSTELTTLSEKISLQKNEKLIGQTVNCLLLEEDTKNKRYLGRTAHYVKVGVKSEEQLKKGSWAKVKITDATPRTVYGKVSN